MKGGGTDDGQEKGIGRKRGGGARADDVDEPAVGSARARISKAMEACAWRYRQVRELGADELARV